MPEAPLGRGAASKLAWLAARNQARRKSAVVPDATGEVQSGADPSGPKSPENETYAEASKQIQVNIDPALRAKLAKLADGAVIRLVGFVSAPLGLQPSIEVQDIAELSEHESD